MTRGAGIKKKPRRERKQKILISVSADDLQAIDARAAETGLSRSAFMVALSVRGNQPLVDAVRELRRQLEDLRGSGDPSDDPGTLICSHGDREVRVHYLGGGIWVCFECWAKLLVGSRLRHEEPQ